MVDREQPGLGALIVTVVAAAVGLGYFVYLNATPFPPVWVRLVPLIWLACALVGLVLGGRVLAGRGRKALALASVVLSVPSIMLAAIFLLAALMGDAPAPPGTAT